MPFKDPKKTKEYMKEYHKNYYLKNKKKISEKNKIYRENPKNKKIFTIGAWKHIGVKCFDWDLLHELYINTTHCEYCNILLKGNGRDCKCLDHDHSINDKFNIRGLLCKKCNNNDVLK